MTLSVSVCLCLPLCICLSVSIDRSAYLSICLSIYISVSTTVSLALSACLVVLPSAFVSLPFSPIIDHRRVNLSLHNYYEITVNTRRRRRIVTAPLIDECYIRFSAADNAMSVIRQLKSLSLSAFRTTIDHRSGCSWTAPSSSHYQQQQQLISISLSVSVCLCLSVSVCLSFRRFPIHIFLLLTQYYIIHEPFNFSYFVEDWDDNSRHTAASAMQSFYELR